MPFVGKSLRLKIIISNAPKDGQFPTRKRDSENNFNQKSSASGTKPSKIFRVHCHYMGSYLSLDFSCFGDKGCPLPLCILCGKKVSHEFIVLSKVK